MKEQDFNSLGDNVTKNNLLLARIQYHSTSAFAPESIKHLEGNLTPWIDCGGQRQPGT